MADRETGKVKWFDAEKGYGFVGRDGGGEDAFVHRSSIMSEGYTSLEPGQEIEFSIIRNEKGPKAVDVDVIYYVVEGDDGEEVEVEAH